jgi:hypothetical protein
MRVVGVVVAVVVAVMVVVAVVGPAEVKRWGSTGGQCLQATQPATV